jgi:hypothetical protein
MKMCTISFAVGLATLAAAASGLGQVTLRGTETSDQSAGNSASSSAVTIYTGDRDVVPLIKQTKETKVDANTQRIESVTRARANDGTYFDWQRSTTTTKEVSPGQSVSSTDAVERDHQGQIHASEHVDVTVNKTASGEADHTAVYMRNSSGHLELDHVVDATAVKGSDGATDTTTIEKTADVSGNLSLLKQVDSVTVNHGPNEQVVTSETKTVNHMNGQLAATAQETTSITTQGNSRQTESVVRSPGSSGWEVTSRSTTTETKAPDGSVNRVTIVDGLPPYSTKTGNEVVQSLVPQTRIVDHEVHNADGTTVLQRDVFHRDVNGSWVQQSFSTKEGDNALSQPSGIRHSED